MSGDLTFSLRVWRQSAANQPGELKNYPATGISPDMSFLEMLDLVNEQLISKGEEPIAFESDCREGICGACSLVINGVPHGPDRGVTACQLHMRSFSNGQQITIEPWRARAFPPVKDLVTDRSAFDRILQKGGYVSVNTGSAVDANTLAITKAEVDKSFDAATCIGCGACVAACKNASAMLFVGAKISHLAKLPQGRVEQKRRVQAMVAQMDAEGFGSCTNTLECEAVCPKEISSGVIGELNLQLFRSLV